MGYTNFYTATVRTCKCKVLRPQMTSCDRVANTDEIFLFVKTFEIYST